MSSGEVLILGASGFLGRRVADALEAEGRIVRRGSRQPAAHGGAAHWVQADVLDADGLVSAMQGCDVVVNLVHLMGEEGNLVRLEQRGAWAVRQAAARTGVSHIVYLGGPKPLGRMSTHLAARLATGEVLRAGAVPTTELRAAMILGGDSESFRMVRDLALRLPVMVFPRWLQSTSSPVGVRDVVAALVHAVQSPPPPSGRWYNLPGPERLTAKEVLLRVASAQRRRPLTFRVPMVGPQLSSWWLRLVTDADFQIARKLVEGLQSDLSDEGPIYWEQMPEHALEPLDEAIRGAFREDAGPRGAARLWEAIAARLTRSDPAR